MNYTCDLGQITQPFQAYLKEKIEILDQAGFSIFLKKKIRS